MSSSGVATCVCLHEACCPTQLLCRPICYLHVLPQRFGVANVYSRSKTNHTPPTVKTIILTLLQLSYTTVCCYKNVYELRCTIKKETRSFYRWPDEPMISDKAKKKKKGGGSHQNLARIKMALLAFARCTTAYPSAL